MRKIKVSEVAGLDPKETIPSIQGVLTKVYDYKSGEGDDGAWSMQVGSLKDSTGEIKVVIKNQNDMRGLLNREVLIKSHSGPKGLSGVYSEDNEWPKDSGKFTRQVKVTATAEISLVDSAPDIAPPPKKTAATAEEALPFDRDPASEYRHGLMRVANALYLNYKAMGVLSGQLKIDGVELTADQIQAGASTAFITLDRQGLVKDLPDRPLWGAKEQLKEKPEPGGDEW